MPFALQELIYAKHHLDCYKIQNFELVKATGNMQLSFTVRRTVLLLRVCASNISQLRSVIKV